MSRPGRLKSHVWARVKRYILRRDPYCTNSTCENISIEVDHRKPIFLGGTNDLENLRGICKECHKKKTARERKIWTSRPRKKRHKGIGPEWRNLIDEISTTP